MTTNADFLASIPNETATAIFSAIAKHYGITIQEAKDEVVAEDAEHLLDYLTGSIRTATSLLMKRFS